MTLAVATASYYLLEMPIRRGAFRRSKVSWTLAPSGAFGLAVAVVLVTRGAIPPIGAYSLEPVPVIDSTANPQPTRVMVVGDSVGESLGPGLKVIGEEGEGTIASWERSVPACGFLQVDKEIDNKGDMSKSQADRCNSWRTTWKGDVEAFRPDVVLFVFGGMDTNDRLVNGAMLKTDTPEWDAYVMDGLQKQLDILSSRGAKLMLATFPYVHPALWALDSNADEKELDAFRRVSALNRVYQEFAAQHPDNVVIADLNGFTCPEGKYSDSVIGGVRLREDGIHYTEFGSIEVANWLVPQIEGAVAIAGPQP